MTNTRRRFTSEERQTHASLQQQIIRVDAELLRLREEEANVDEISAKRDIDRQIFAKTYVPWMAMVYAR